MFPVFFFSVVVCFNLENSVSLVRAGCVDGVMNDSLSAGKLQLGEPLVYKVPKCRVSHHFAVHTQVGEIGKVACV